MNHLISSNRVIKLCILAISLIFSLVSCGGDSKGTGGRDVQGIVRSAGGAPLAGFEITINNGEDRDVTDSSGGYMLFTESTATSLEFTVSGAGPVARGTVTGLPANDLSLTLDFAADFESGELTPTTIDAAPTGDGGDQGDDDDDSPSNPPADNGDDDDDHPGTGGGNGDPDPCSDDNCGGNGGGNGGNGGGGATRLTICHLLPSGRTQTLEIDDSALEFHLMHGDTEGACE